jgi:hypothetical protein
MAEYVLGEQPLSMPFCDSFNVHHGDIREIFVNAVMGGKADEAYINFTYFILIYETKGSRRCFYLV